jgi:filamentous hemagglutinin family protein
MTRILNPLRRSRTSCSVLAIATVMAFGATPAQAQFVGTIDTSAGIDTVNSTNSNLIITNQQAVINWTATDTPTGGQIAFLPDSNSVTFSSGSDFAVLNRITPGTAGNAIYMGGNISSFAGDFTGGTVYFYSPNGIIIGQNASINVGSLGLTTLPITDDGQGNWMTGFGGANPSVTFGQATNPNSFIRTNAAIDGSIRANGAGNYVALVAPIINHAGTILTDGGAALVAAEAASITFSDSGLYNIQVTTGSGAAQSLTVNGGRIERNSQTIGGDRHAYLVAVPKNDLTTMLITGGANIGFDIAGSAGVEGNTVVLRSGYTDVDEFGFSYVDGQKGNLTIDHAAFSSNVQTIAYGDTQISTYNGPTSFSGNLEVINDFTAFVGATTDDLTIGGNLNVRTFGSWSFFGQPIVSLWAGAGATLSTGNVGILANTRGANSPDEFSPGENVTGGTINITANDGGHILINGSLSGEASGTGGAQDYSGGVGGNGTGGTINVKALGAGSSISAGATELLAYGIGGSTSECTSCNISGGIGHGGTIDVQLDQGAATMTFGGLNTWAQGIGGDGIAGGDGGDGIGGTSNLSIGGGSTLTVNGNYFNFADGGGGAAEDAGNAGDGHGGSAALLSTSGGGQIFFKGANAYVTADAGGGAASGSGNGGDAFTGSASINVTNTVISVANAAQTQPFGQIYVKSDAFGGASVGGAGGSADASTGPVSITLGTGSSLTAGRLIVTEAKATGGNGVSGGAAKGGTASINVNSGGTLNGEVNQIADATAGAGSSGPGGTATGGTAALLVTGGTANLTNYLADTSASGGDSTSGAGGNATSGRTAISVNGGTLHATGNLFIDSGAIGGDGLSGGYAAGLVSPPENEGSPVAAGLYVQNGGSLDVDGLTVISTEAVGGNASNGNGGNAVAGEAEVIAFFGAIDLNSLSIDANAYGGGGGNGGNGGSATGGPVDIAFGLGAAAIGGTITLGSAIITADGEGGDGGAGTDGNTGGNGGAGGAGSGGGILFTGAAANGTLGSGAAIITALGQGGAGGAGGNGDTGSGGNGGAGGVGTGGRIQTGTLSAEMAPTSGGGATYTTLSLNSSAFGGDGGAGGTGGGGTGVGGNGGNAIGGSASFLSRGALVTADAVTLTVNANGGDGGAGSVQGNGGNARTGSMAVESKERFGHADQRGTLNANTIVGSAVAEGGIGAVNGTSSAIGSSYFRVLNGDATIGSLDFTISASTYDNTFASSFVSVRDGTATITGDFSFTTPGTLVLDASLGSMNAGTISLAAGSFTGTFIVDNVVQTQAGPGTYTASSIDISTGGDFITNAHLVSGGSLDILAPGLIDMRNATSTDGSISLDAGSTINGGNLDAAGFVDVDATDDITLGNIVAGDFINVTSELGAISLGLLSATNNIDLDAARDIGFGNVAADAFDFSAGGDVIGGDILAGTQASGEADGAIDLGNISVGIQMQGGAAEDGFAVGMSSATSIHVLDVEADESIGFATLGTLTAGNLDAGQNVMALVGGDMNLGSITTAPGGRTYLADVSMFLDNGGLQNNFDPAPVLLSPPVATGGSITVGGPVSTGRFQAAAGTSLTTGQITAQQIEASAGGLATVNGIWSAPFVSLISGDIDIGASGGIEGDSESSVLLQSTNGEGALIGDGLSGSGYRLTNAEFGRISTGELTIVVGGVPGAAADTLIGDLDITGPSAGSTIESSTGGVTFVTLDEAGEGLDGTLRIVGDVNATGFGDDNYLSFQTQHFELDAATGLLNIEGAQGALGGQLWITAQNVHVASGDILDQLAEDPQYDGYQEDLNAPATVERSDGVIRARTMDLEFFGGGEGQPNTLYVQNTGTSGTPAGFLVSDIGLGDDGEGGLPPNSLNLIINGQIVTGTGTLTGIEVRDALVASEGDLTPFTANSTINGCLLVGACVQTPNNPLPPDFTPTPGIQDEIVLIGDEPAPPPEFGNEDVIDDNDEETEDTSPIVPPEPLFDTSEMGEPEAKGNPAFNTAMRSHPGLVEEGDVDDPVSGGGNPALMEADAPPTGNQEMQP